ncbi:MAG: hypothetical protein WEC15_00810 [Flavobacteriales bacterium]
MANKRFKSRRHWYNAILMLWTTPFALLIGVIAFAGTGSSMILTIMIGLAIAGFAVAILRDLSGRGVYTLEGEKLILQNRSQRVEVPLTEVLDVSLIDRAGAREFIVSGLRKKGVSGFFRIRREARSAVRFTSLDIGLTSYTMGIGRRMTDRMPDARLDLVLLRLRNGDIHFLSPFYNQELVSAITRRTALGTSKAELPFNSGPGSQTN